MKSDENVQRSANHHYNPSQRSPKDIIDVKISSISKAFRVLLLIIGSVDTERKQKEPYITTTFIKKTLDFR